MTSVACNAGSFPTENDGEKDWPPHLQSYIKGSRLGAQGAEGAETMDTPRSQTNGGSKDPMSCHPSAVATWRRSRRVSRGSDPP